MVLNLAGESIECIKCELIARKVVPSCLIKDDKLGSIMKYECSLNSSAENLVELNPKEFIYKFSSNLEMGTLLQAHSIYFITTKLRRIKYELIMKSGRHHASKAIIDDYTFAEIKYPLENVLNSINKRKELK